MAFPNVTGDRQAYDYAKALLSDNELMESYPDIEREYRYIVCWATRRLKEYRTADYYCTTSIKEWPEDPRFYQGRCINTSAWLDDEKKDECPRTLKDAIADAEQALKLCYDDEKEYGELIGVNYNNLSYLWAKQAAADEGSAQASVRQARAALIKLKEWTDKATWVPNHPEYLHTEAFIEFQEYSVWKKQNKDKELLKAKLEHALRDIEAAVSLVKGKTLYEDLKKKIEKALARCK
jgi:hypothetical protein